MREAYTAYLEDRLSRTLSQIEGAGEVKVMITLKSSAEKVLDKGYGIGSGNSDRRRQPGRDQTVVKDIKKIRCIGRTVKATVKGSGSPYVSKELSPKIEGVVVIADGGENAVVKRKYQQCGPGII